MNPTTRASTVLCETTLIQRELRAGTRLGHRLHRLVWCAAAITLSQAAFAQTARQGEEQIRHVFTFVDRNTMRQGDITVIQRELNGVSLNDKGGGMFNNLGMRCLATIVVEGGKPLSNGRCVAVDTDGDQVFHTFENRAGTGAHILVGGTGKYTGISGREDFVITGGTRAPEGMNALVIPLKATWKLP